MTRSFGHLSKGVLGLVLVAVVLMLDCKSEPENKYRKLVVVNYRPYRLEVFIKYQHPAGDWRMSGPWIVDSGERIFMSAGWHGQVGPSDDGGSVGSSNDTFYYYAHQTMINYLRVGDFSDIPMKAAKLPVNSGGHYELSFGDPASSGDSFGGFVVFLLVVGLIGLAIYHLSPAGGYRNGFQAGSEGKPESFFYRHIAGEATKEAYRRGYHDGQMKRIGDK